MSGKSTVHSAGVDAERDDATVLVTRSESIATITLNRPEQLNAINRYLIEELHAAVLACEEDREIACIILTGSGRAFCSGDDLKAMPNEFVMDEAFAESVGKLQDISRLLVLGPKPTVAAVRGWAVGGGLSWVINCDAPILSEDTVCFFPETPLGLSVTGGVTRLLPATIGRMRAHSMLITGRRISAHEALEYGLATAVVPGSALTETAVKQAQAYAALPPTALDQARRMLRGFEREQFEQALANEAVALSKLASEMSQTRAWPRIE